jgi:protease-4
MRRFIVGFFAFIGILVVLLVVAGAGFVWWQRSGEAGIADDTVLTLELGTAFPDAPPSSGIAKILFPERAPLRDVLDALARAGDDPHIAGLIAHVGDGEFGIAETQELRDAIAAFRAKGKRAIAYADSFGEFGPGTRSYYLATSFDEIWLQPMGLVGLVGLRAEEPFVRGTLDLLGLKPSFERREEYKSAADPLTETKMTPADREQNEALLRSIFGQIVRGIATSRKLDEGEVRSLVDRGPLLAQEALQVHLIDHIGYSDEAVGAFGAARERVMPLARYLAHAGRPNNHGPTIALIYASGLITRGESNDNPLTGSPSLTSGAVVAAFRAAARDPAVRAILFRIDSPGGSAVASESIWRATMRAKAAGKPIIVSMGDVAGSGGYYIAAGADKIVAQPATLTGSIGVIAGKIILGGLLEKFGARWDSVQIGEHASMFSALEDFTPDGHRRFEAVLDDVYDIFKSRVAEGRKLDAAAVEALAKGRIWSGEDAKARGLVDALGGFDTALALAKEAAKIPANGPVSLKLYPPPVDTAHLLLDRLLGREPGPDDEAETTLGRSLLALAPL